VSGCNDPHESGSVQRQQRPRRVECLLRRRRRSVLGRLSAGGQAIWALTSTDPARVLAFPSQQQQQQPEEDAVVLCPAPPQLLVCPPSSPSFPCGARESGGQARRGRPAPPHPTLPRRSSIVADPPALANPRPLWLYTSRITGDHVDDGTVAAPSPRARSRSASESWPRRPAREWEPGPSSHGRLGWLSNPSHAHSRP
jgi:hypothetical protein